LARSGEARPRAANIWSVGLVAGPLRARAFHALGADDVRRRSISSLASRSALNGGGCRGFRPPEEQSDRPRGEDRHPPRATTPPRGWHGRKLGRRSFAPPETVTARINSERPNRHLRHPTQKLIDKEAEVVQCPRTYRTVARRRGLMSFRSDSSHSRAVTPVVQMDSEGCRDYSPCHSTGLIGLGAWLPQSPSVRARTRTLRPTSRRGGGSGTPVP
jgi:hypothetical protein